jgi:hypothetical protein
MDIAYLTALSALAGSVFGRPDNGHYDVAEPTLAGASGPPQQAIGAASRPFQ